MMMEEAQGTRGRQQCEEMNVWGRIMEGKWK
jgi:hypothetical protein